jgi:hypothetical protein
MGEFIYTGFDHRFDLSVSSVRLPVDPGDVATIKFPASKTDPFRKGVTVINPFAPPHIYPFRALTRLVSRAESRRATPLFRLNGQPFSKFRVTSMLSKALSNTGHDASK